jgi:hypothetical protein
MGLDMYLTAEKFLSDFFEDDAAKTKKIQKYFPELTAGKIKTISAEVGYWRKANAVHNWFVQKCQDGVDECQKTWVSKDRIQDLLDTVNKVLADKQLAEELLPTASGFFFGGTDYNEWYFQDLEDTKKICENVLSLLEQEKGWDIYYQSSW